MACGVSPMMKVVCLVWWTLVLVKITGWSALGFCDITGQGRSGLSGGLTDRLWYNRFTRTASVTSHQ